MSEYSELVKRLRDSYAVDAEIRFEAAQAIERLGGEKIELERRATFIEHDHPQTLEPHFTAAMSLLTTRKAYQKGEIARLIAEQMQQLADARAEIGRLKNAIEFAHSEGFEWPADPLPSEALATPAPGKDSEGKE